MRSLPLRTFLLGISRVWLAAWAFQVRLCPRWNCRIPRAGERADLRCSFHRLYLRLKIKWQNNHALIGPLPSRRDPRRRGQQVSVDEASTSELCMDARSYGWVAWLDIIVPQDKLQDGKKALELATKSCELSDWKDTMCLSVFAAARAECGDYKDAVKWQKKVIEMDHGDKEDMDEARRRLKLYEAGKPYRDE
jgi:hypothetical protein